MPKILYQLTPRRVVVLFFVGVAFAALGWKLVQANSVGSQEWFVGNWVLFWGFFILLFRVFFPAIFTITLKCVNNIFSKENSSFNSIGMIFLERIMTISCKSA
jgi:hypothetical protein